MYDFVVLGGGSAGYAAARTAADLGLKAAVVDGAKTLGGLCILRGCMPSKTLIESANRALVMREAEAFGLRVGPVEARVEEVIARKRRLIAEFADYRQEQLADGRFDLIRGRARYASANRITVDLLEGGRRDLEAATSLVATGSVISVPSISGLEEVGYWTSDDLLEAERLPASMVVLGGGAVALEMAHYLHGMGTQVTVIQRSPHVLKEMDGEIAAVVEQAFRERGMDVRTDTRLIRLEEAGENRKRVVFEQGGEERIVEAEEVFLGLGRQPATEGMGLEEAGVEREGKLVRVDARQRSSQSSIYAAGDVCGPLEVVHLAIEQGETAAHNAAVALGTYAGPEREMDYRLKLFGVFTEPQAATVGASEQELRERGVPFRSASYPFDDHGKSMVMGALHGFVKLLADPESGKILGASVVGPEAVELIHEITVAMHFDASAGDLVRIPHYHPTLSEIWTYPAEELMEGQEK